MLRMAHRKLGVFHKLIAHTLMLKTSIRMKDVGIMELG
jgi:hypothetical protein